MCNLIKRDVLSTFVHLTLSGFQNSRETRRDCLRLRLATRTRSSCPAPICTSLCPYAILWKRKIWWASILKLCGALQVERVILPHVVLGLPLKVNRLAAQLKYVRKNPKTPVMLSGARPGFPPQHAKTTRAGDPAFGRAESKHPYGTNEVWVL
jgi:hypothetical protein